jgi:hypothetical protein
VGARAEFTQTTKIVEIRDESGFVANAQGRRREVDCLTHNIRATSSCPLRIIDREFITFQIPFIRFITMAINMLQGNALVRVGAALSVVVLILSFMQPEVSLAQNVLTQHNDLSRSGADPNETILTTTNVTEGTFGKVFTLPIDGFTYAQPLYDANVSIDGGTHNVLYVATAHDTVYAFDADSGTEYWHVSLGTPVPSSVIGTGNIQVEVGIIATPVIDPTNGTLYVTAKTYESGVQIFRLHALNISTGAEKFGGPVEIAAGSFNAAKENQRAAVTLVNGVVYLAFGSHEDYTPYHGFILGYSASTLQQVQVFNVTPNGGQGAIWMGGQGLVADAFNNLYAITANSSQSSENSADDYGESFIKLVPNGNSLTLADYFKPNQYDSWNASDADLGSTGAFAIPGTSYIAGGSKSGLFFVVNTNNMGKLDFSSNQSHQEFQATNGLWGSPAFFNNVMYIWGVNEPLKAYQWNGSDFDTSPASQSTYSPPGGTTSGTVSVSSNGTTAGTTIVWGTAPTADPDHATVGGNLYAYDATNLSRLLWSTSQNSSRDSELRQVLRSYDRQRQGLHGNRFRAGGGLRLALDYLHAHPDRCVHLSGRRLEPGLRKLRHRRFGNRCGPRPATAHRRIVVLDRTQRLHFHGARDRRNSIERGHQRVYGHLHQWLRSQEHPGVYHHGRRELHAFGIVLGIDSRTRQQRH